jgi:hypothetical protein
VWTSLGSFGNVIWIKETTPLCSHSVRSNHLIRISIAVSDMTSAVKLR